MFRHLRQRRRNLWQAATLGLQRGQHLDELAQAPEALGRQQNLPHQEDREGVLDEGHVGLAVGHLTKDIFGNSWGNGARSVPRGLMKADEKHWLE